MMYIIRRKGSEKGYFASRGAILAENLNKGGLGCLLHLETLAEVAGSSITVLAKRKKLRKFGFSDKNIFIEYQSGNPGHWTLYGGRDVEGEDNDCLFSTVGKETGKDPTVLRKKTAEKLFHQEWVIEESIGPADRSGALLGGAKYSGNSEYDAGHLIDESHGTVGHGHVRKAHPRGHASHPSATGPEDSVEKYSQSSAKSGWMSRNDQNFAMHKILKTEMALDAMDQLNKGLTTRAAFSIAPDFEVSMAEWFKGEIIEGPLRARQVQVVLQHHADKQNMPEADVQVFTCFPKK